MGAVARIVLFHIRRWRATRGRTLLSVIGIAAGSATVVAVVALTGSLAASVRRATADVAVGADLQVSGITEGGFGPDVVDIVIGAPGVDAAAPMVRTPVRVGDAATEVLLLGVDQRILDFAGAVQVDPDATPPDSDLLPIVIGLGLAADAGLTEGDTVAVTSPRGSQDAVVAAVIDDARLNRVNDGVVAVADLPVAQALAGKGDRVDAVLVRAAGGTPVGELERSLRAAVDGRAVVDSPDLLVDQANSVIGTVTQGMITGGSLAVGMGGFLVYTTMSMAALERRRELATMRALGGRRRTLLLSFLGEAAVLGLVGSFIGCGLGALVASSLVGALPPFLLASFGVRIGFAMPVVAIPLGLLVGVGAAVLAAVLPGRRAVSVPPVEAMRPEGVLETGAAGRGVVLRTLALGLALVAAGAACFFVAPGGLAAGGGFALLTVGAPIAMLGIEGPLTATAARAARWFRTPGRLASASLERAPRRVWSTMVAVFTGVGLVVGNGGLVNSTTQSLIANVASGRPPDLYVAADSDGNVGNGGVATTTLLPDEWAAEIAALDGVASVGGTQYSYATIGRRRVLLQGVTDGVVDPALDDLRPGADGVLVSTALADALHLDEGSVFALPTASGPVDLTVGGVFESFKSNQGVAVVDLALLQEVSGRPGVSSYDISLSPGADSVMAAVEGIVRDHPFPVTVQTGDEYYDDVHAAVLQNTAAFVALQWVVVLAASLAVFNTLVISVVERRRELGILRAIGTDRKTLVRSVVSESLAVGVGGTVLGVVGGLVLSVLGTNGLARSTGTPLHFAFSIVPIVVAVGAGVVVSMLGGIFPATRAARVDVVSAIGYE